ncbi:hypothetical protein PHJA_002282100 [Phtheirospermum japonicum]|uniref:Uncharacterized protein n=1 Tax=Phtheirospermum japonicum TaxID=374723 RepID=A0A830D4R4_9LAMI|nr:hypothetical protein PHJA_002282100 [Phtheirospermum japonicum]
MYVTRRLSQLLKSPEILTAQPSSDGPNSGFLVIQDEESETYTCFGCCKRRALKNLPFPQNKELLIRYTSFVVDKVEVSEDPVFFIPVLNQPLSSNHYYAIIPHGKHKGKAFTCSREEDKATCCFCRCVKDVKPRPLDPHNIYQQFQIAPHQSFLASTGSFFATSIASDGFPPYFVRRGGWTINTKTHNLKLGTAQGLDSSLRARLPEFNLSLSQKSSQPLVVGKWYCPFIFVKEGTLKDQVKRSMYYEMTLEQRWESIFAFRKNNSNDTKVAIDVVLENEEVLVGGSRGEWDERSAVDGVIWFKSNGSGGGRASVGLRVEIVERMKWEQARGGWVGGSDERRVKINKVEKVKKGEGWSEFGCYALVERFNLRRMDGSLVMSYDFRHFHKLKTKWE